MRAVEFEKDSFLESYLTRWRSEVQAPLASWKLQEAKLSQAQIDTLFGDVEQKMSSDKTALGKGLDVAGKAAKVAGKGARLAPKLLPSNIVNKIDELIKETKPVKAFDAKFEQAKQTLRLKMGGDNSKLVKYIENYSEMAKKRPIVQAATIAILTIAAGIATGPGGAAAVGALLRTGNELLKGERFSKALLKGAGTGIVAAIAGMTVKELAHLIGDTMIDQVYVEQTAKDPGIHISSSRTSLTFSDTNSDGTSEIKKIYLDIMGTPDEIELINSTIEKVQESLGNGDIDQASRLMKTLSGDTLDPEDLVNQTVNLSEDGKDKVIHWIGQFVGKELADETAASSAVMRVASDFENKVKMIQKGLEQAAVAIASGASSIDRNRTNPEESMQLSEADLKSIANNIASWAKDKASAVGKEMSQTVTVKKLIAAWDKAGKPTDSDAVHAIMKSAGVPDSVLQQAFAGSKIPLPKAPSNRVPKEPKVSTGDVSFDKQINDIITTKGKDAAIQYLNDLKTKMQSPAPVQTKHGDVKKASDGQEYKLDVGQAGDRIWFNVATGAEASDTIDKELEGTVQPKAKTKAKKKKRPSVPKNATTIPPTTQSP